MKEKTFKINPTTVIVTTVKEDFLDPDNYIEFDYKQAASDLIDSLGEEYCILFINELMDKCEEIIIDHHIKTEIIDGKLKKND